MAYIPPKFNTNVLSSDFSWLQKGYSYGYNDSGPWQKFKRSGLYTSCLSWYNTLLNAGWTVTMTMDSVDNRTYLGKATVEASCGWAFPQIYGTETPENIWELDPQDEQKDLLNADFPNGTINATSKDTRTAVSKLAEYDGSKWYLPGASDNGSAYGLALTSDTAYVFDDGALNVNVPTAWNDVAGEYEIDEAAIKYKFVHLPSADYSVAFSLYLMLKAGIESFPIEASTIRHTMLTSNQWVAMASFNNQGRIISSPSMYSVEGVPSTLLFSVPVLPSPLQFIETPGDLQYGWRKIRPHVSRLSRMKWRITQNYQFGLWPVKAFGMVL